MNRRIQMYNIPGTNVYDFKAFKEHKEAHKLKTEIKSLLNKMGRRLEDGFITPQNVPQFKEEK